MKRFLLRSLALLIALLFVFFSFDVRLSKAEDSPDLVVIDFLAAMSDYDIETCMLLMESSLMAEVYTQVEMGGLLSSLLTGLDMDGMSLISMLPMLVSFAQFAGMDIDLPQWEGRDFVSRKAGNQAEVECIIVVTMGKQIQYYEGYFFLVKEGGAWRIADMR